MCSTFFYFIFFEDNSWRQLNGERPPTGYIIKFLFTYLSVKQITCTIILIIVYSCWLNIKPQNQFQVPTRASNEMKYYHKITLSPILASSLLKISFNNTRILPSPSLHISSYRTSMAFSSLNKYRSVQPSCISMLQISFKYFS